MADINSELLSRRRAPADERPGNASPADAKPQLMTFVELLFFAYRDFTREADTILAEFGLGRAHHRVLHFVNRNPGLRVADLLDILKITKQSLARVLKQLVDEGWIEQMAGASDRRQRLLYATDKGAVLSHRLDAVQTRRVAEALSAAGAADHAEVARFLFAMITKEERALVEMLLPEPVGTTAAPRT
jgi:DNA-binding MarR family transcriptional regulator